MAWLHPAIHLHRVTDIRGELLAERGIRALFLDLDNTLTTHNNPIPDRAVLAWLHEMKALGVTLVLVSNNKAKRVRPFAEELGLPFTSRALKPLPWGFMRTARELGLPPAAVAVVGDQLFTDILGGNLFGAPTSLVDLMEPETGWFFRLKRRIERRLLRKHT
jgi:HAD superfamily phosphatase (TIGR01668 family)